MNKIVLYLLKQEKYRIWFDSSYHKTLLTNFEILALLDASLIKNVASVTLFSLTLKKNKSALPNFVLCLRFVSVHLFNLSLFYCFLSYLPFRNHDISESWIFKPHFKVGPSTCSRSCHSKVCSYIAGQHNIIYKISLFSLLYPL